MDKSASLTLTVLAGFPMVEPGDNLCELIIESIARTPYQDQTLTLAEGDVLVLAQKIVSKAEDRYHYLNQVEPSDQAKTLAIQIDKDPRLVELILSESDEVVRHRPGVIVVAHKNGYVHANAGIDKSNIQSDENNPRVLLLPVDSDASAAGLREAIRTSTGKNVHVIINDSAGRAWRNGTAGMAIGTAGFEPVVDLIGEPDLFNRPMEVTQVAVADELAAAASFMMGQAAQAAPVVLVRGARLTPSDAGSQTLIRPKECDMFR
jgi:coenzyme F420-0:L-glutamate ligase / coenzyme F420-1:gamma-L-glutamate ligase